MIAESTTMEVNAFVNSLQEKFNGSNLAFEEFALQIGEFAQFVLEKNSWNNLAEAIFAVDWSGYSNDRGGMIQSMKSVLESGRRSEEDHVRFIRGLKLSISFPNHDCTKDAFYSLMTALRFRVKNFDEKEGRWFVRFFQLRVFKPHASHEPHHPEFEEFTDGKCSMDDVAETAVDRMARNFQFSEDGQGDVQLMEKFKPKWKFDNEIKLKHYEAIVSECYDEIGRQWREFAMG